MGNLPERPGSSGHTPVKGLWDCPGDAAVYSCLPTFYPGGAMGRPERPLDPAAGPIQAFASELRLLRQQAGQSQVPADATADRPVANRAGRGRRRRSPSYLGHRGGVCPGVRRRPGPVAGTLGAGTRRATLPARPRHAARHRCGGSAAATAGIEVPALADRRRYRRVAGRCRHRHTARLSYHRQGGHHAAGDRRRLGQGSYRPVRPGRSPGPGLFVQQADSLLRGKGL